MLKRLIDRLRTAEDGFTLIELLVVVVLVSILCAIASLLIADKVRAAEIASLKSDVRSSADVVYNKSVGGDLSKEFVSSDEFDKVKASSNDNDVVLYTDYTDASNPVACILGTRKFSDTDIVYESWSSTDRKLVDGNRCSGMDEASTETGTGGTGGDDTTTEPGTGSGSDTGSDGSDDSTTPTGSDNSTTNDDTVNNGKVQFNVTYLPQNTSLNFCYAITMSTSSTDPVNWEYKIDLNQPPFNGADPSTFTSTYNYVIKSNNNGVITLYGGDSGWNATIKASDGTRQFGFCSTSTPEPKLDTSKYVLNIYPLSSNNNYNACVEIDIASDYIYPIPWETILDLKTYFKSIAKVGNPTFQWNLSYTNKGDYVYDVTGSGLNRYVDAHEPRTNTQAICYNPQGNPW